MRHRIVTRWSTSPARSCRHIESESRLVEVGPRTRWVCEAGGYARSPQSTLGCEQMSSAGEVITLSLPLSARHASTVRVVAASLAADCGFNIDEIDDLRLGINEAVSIMTDIDAPPQARLLVEFEVQALDHRRRRPPLRGRRARSAPSRSTSSPAASSAWSSTHSRSPTARSCCGSRPRRRRRPRSDGRSRRRRVVRRVPTEPAAQCQEQDRRTSPRPRGAHRASVQSVDDRRRRPPAGGDDGARQGRRSVRPDDRERVLGVCRAHDRG